MCAYSNENLIVGLHYSMMQSCSEMGHRRCSY